jgi:hypothetical protein
MPCQRNYRRGVPGADTGDDLGALPVAARQTYIDAMDHRKKTADSAPADARSGGLHSSTMPTSKKRTKSKTGVVVFGTAKIRVELPGTAEIARNVKLGQSAFIRVKDRLLDSGIRLRKTRGVPLYHTDPKQPTLIIQRLNGKLSRGVIRDGKFVAIE